MGGDTSIIGGDNQSQYLHQKWLKLATFDEISKSWDGVSSGDNSS